MPESETATRARFDWEKRVGRRRPPDPRVYPTLEPPGQLSAEPGAGQVTLRWSPVKGAAGYLVHSAPSREGPWQPVDHGGGDVLAVPGPLYTDTTNRPGAPAWYAVASLPAADAPPGPLGNAISTSSRTGPARGVAVTVEAGQTTGRLPRPWRMLGTEHLSQLLDTRDWHGFPIGSDFAQALRIARRELGTTLVRAHGTFLDELGIVQPDGRFDFSALDRVYDQLLSMEIRPVVELSFMPSALARDRDARVFEYGGIVSPPADWNRWRDLVGGLAAHLVARFGLDEVSGWGFEVWNEANLEIFWSGSRDEYMRLYDIAARAIKAVSPRLRVGGPATAAAGWIGDFADFVAKNHAPADFVSTHTYGNLPLDCRATALIGGLDRREQWWTEWGVTPRHGDAVNDRVFGAPFVLHGMLAALDRIDYLAYWVLSDHFEELGRPDRLFHGGFGLLTMGNLRKARFWAIYLLERMGESRLQLEVTGDGAEGMVNALAARDGEDRVRILIWNGTLDQSKQAGDALLDRPIELTVEGLAGAAWTVRHVRVDEAHSNILATWERLGSPDWPDDGAMEMLRAADRLEEFEPAHSMEAKEGRLSISFDLPMPGVSCIELTP